MKTVNHFGRPTIAKLLILIFLLIFNTVFAFAHVSNVGPDTGPDNNLNKLDSPDATSVSALTGCETIVLNMATFESGLNGWSIGGIDA